MTTRTGLDSPLWFPNWKRSISEWARAQRERVLVEQPPTAFQRAIARVPEGAWWLLALAGLAVCFTLAATGPWG